jgi:hypothetical protein
MRAEQGLTDPLRSELELVAISVAVSAAISYAVGDPVRRSPPNVGPMGGVGVIPHTGAEVRVEPFPATVGTSFGNLLFVGATRPA